MMMSKTGDNKDMPETLHGVMKRYFALNFSRYEAVFNRTLNTKDLLDNDKKLMYSGIVKELVDFKKKPADDEISLVMYESICEKFAPPPPKPAEPNSMVDMDQFNEYLADSHADESDDSE